MSAWKYATKGVIPAKFQLTCNGNLVDTVAEANAVGDVQLELIFLGGGAGGTDVIIEDTTTGSANSGNLFRFDDASDLYIYNINIKGLAKGGYRIRIIGGGDTQDEFFRIT